MSNFEGPFANTNSTTDPLMRETWGMERPQSDERSDRLPPPKKDHIEETMGLADRLRSLTSEGSTGPSVDPVALASLVEYVVHYAFLNQPEAAKAALGPITQTIKAQAAQLEAVPQETDGPQIFRLT